MAQRKIKNYKFFSNYDFFTPGPGGVGMILLMFILGALIANLISVPLFFIPGADQYLTMVAYPVMFIPPMIYCANKSRENSFFGSGFKLSNHHYEPLGLWICAILVIVVTLTTSVIADSIITLLPPMPERLEKLLEGITQGNFLTNFLCVSIFAPFFEEWLCRGMILRGLLNYEHKNKQGESVRGIKPVWAIVISAAIFAIIHFNPWQAIAAFMLGMLFGYVYYRTGSIWLTMLMHFANNTFALLLSRVDKLQEADNLSQMLPAPLFWALLVFCIAFAVYFVYKFLCIKTLGKEGSCARVDAV